VTPIDRSRLPAIGPTPAFRLPAPVKHILQNGMRVWTVERRDVPVVTVLLLVPSGSGQDPSGRPGLAAITGDMLDEGSGDRSALDMQDALARLGALFDTEIGADTTVLTLTTLSRFAGEGLALLADITWRPRFDDADFERVRELRVNRLTQLRDVPASLADRAFTHLLYRGDSYGHLPIGTEAGLRAASIDEVRAFHAVAYRPSRMTLVAVGDAAHAELTGLAEETMGAWVPGPEGGGGVAPAPEGVTERRAGDAASLWVVKRPGAAQSELRIGHLGAARGTPDYHALLVLNTILGGQFVSRINMNLREDKGYTYGARTTFDFRRRRGPFLFQASVQTDVTAAAIREALFELEAIRGSRPATRAELELAQASLTRGYPRNFETAEQIARAMAQLALYDLPDDYFERFVPSVLSVDADTVTRVAREYLQPSSALTVVVGDTDATAASLPDLGLGAPGLIGVAEVS
jgi:predicted Zn-dependent peptidase